jgi:HK97 family phage major capsid protein
MKIKKPVDQLRDEGLPVQERAFRAEVESVDIEAREAVFSFSSEYEVKRWYGVEILDHQAESIDLERINNGGAFLMDHDSYDQRGVVLSAWLGADKRCHCKIKFSRNPKGEELLVDVADGIRTQVSVRYNVIDMVLERQESDTDFFRITKWEPTEISSVSIAADPSVGVGRSTELQPQDAAKQLTLNPVNVRGMSAMAKDNKDTAIPLDEVNGKGENKRSTSNAEPERVQVVQEARSEASDIAKTAKEYGAAELGNEYISLGRSHEEFKGALLKQLSDKRSASKDSKDMSTALHLDLPESDLRSYSLMNVVRGLANGDLKKFAPHEFAISNAMAERADKDAHGIFVPHEVLGHGMRSMNTGVAGKGQEMVPTDLMGGEFIEALRQQAVLGGLGARFLTGLQGNVDIPKQTGSATFYWLNEDGDVTDSDLALATVQMTPRTVAGSVALTRRMMVQTGGGIESLVRGDLLTGLASAMDAEGLGTILAAAGVGAVDMTGGIDWAKVVEFESDVGESNYTGEMLHYLARASMIGNMKTSVKAAGTAEFLVQGGQCNGYPMVRHNGVPPNDLLFGDFSNLMYGLWGTVDLSIDKSTKAASGGTVLRVFQDADTAIRHEAAFSYGNTL